MEINQSRVDIRYIRRDFSNAQSSSNTLKRCETLANVWEIMISSSPRYIVIRNLNCCTVCRSNCLIKFFKIFAIYLSIGSCFICQFCIISFHSSPLSIYRRAYCSFFPRRTFVRYRVEKNLWKLLRWQMNYDKWVTVSRRLRASKERHAAGGKRRTMKKYVEMAKRN